MFFFITIIGVGFCAVASRSTGLHVVNFPSFAFPLFGIFSIGFLSLIINFFTGVGSIGFYVALTPFFIIGLFNFRKIDIEFFKILTIVTILLTPVAYVTNPGYDGGLYHLPHQKWIRDEAIVLGLANLHGRFGFSSLLEYVNAPLWIAENFKLLPYVSGAFLVSFIVFTFQSINSQAPVIRILTVLISVSLIVFNKFIPLNYTSTDSPGGWLFCMTVVIGAGLITHMNPFGLPTSGATAKANYLGLLFVFLLFSMFSFSIKGSNILIFLWGAIVVIQLLRMGLIKPLQLAKISIIPLFFLFLFLLRGVLTTGCIVYPASWSCLDVVWSAEANAINDSNWITAWARHPRTGLSSLESWSWIQDYWIGANSAFLIWFGISAATVFSVTALAKKQLQFERRHKQEIAAGILAIFLALMLWFVKAPNPRFGLGPLLSSALSASNSSSVHTLT